MTKLRVFLFNKQLGIKTINTPSSSVKHRGQLFKTLNFIQHYQLCKLHFFQPTDFFKKLFNIPLSLSQNPPHQGCTLQIKLSNYPSLCKKQLILIRLKYCLAIWHNCLWTSSYFINVIIHVSLLLSSTRSRITALDVAQVNITM